MKNCSLIIFLLSLVSFQGLCQENLVKALPASGNFKPEGKPAKGLEKLVVLQGLDKVTARISRIEAPINVTILFGSLALTARACYRKPPEETPESAAFLEIDDIGSDNQINRFFSGWMFASSPALSALEHPVYDVTVVDCMSSSRASSGSSVKKSARASKADDNKW